MHHFMKELREKAKKNLKTIVFPETEDPRVAEAMKILEKEGLCKALSITEEERERSRIALKNLLPDETMINNNHIGALLVKEGKADGMVSGSLSPTANVLKATFKIVGTDKPEMKVSSCFIMLKKQVFFFADCAVQPHPDSEALADIAVTTAATAQSLGVTPKVAMLSFSSKGSANTESVENIKKATMLAKKKGFLVDGELQVDAAINKAIARKKLKEDVLEGEANVLIFPNLNAGNIGYKLVQQLGGYEAIGPILQGLKKPVNDLSRGCSAEDIVNVAVITSLQTN